MNKNDLTRVMTALNLTIAGENAKSHYLNACCPFAPFGLHKNSQDRSASFGCRYDDRGISTFKCYACKQHGTVTSLIRRLGDLRRVDYSALLNDARALEQGIVSHMHFEPFDRPYEETPAIEPLDEMIYDGIFPSAWEVDESRNYLISRGISEETVAKLGLLFRDTYPVDRADGTVGSWYRADILFPVRDRQGQLYGWSGRTTRDHSGIKPKVFDRDLPKRHLILGEHRWRPGLPKFIVEGLFGYAHLIEIGVEEFCDVGALMGSVLTPEKAAILKDWGDPVVAALDNDDAGDVGLFGPLDENDNRDERQAMVPMLVNSLVLLVPSWPVVGTDCNIGEKTDPDELTYDEVYAMTFETLPFVAPKPKRFSVDKHFNGGYKRA